MRNVMEGRVQMRDVKVRRSELLEKVTANRQKHIEEYDEAVAGYKAAALAAIERGVTKLRQQVTDLEAGEVLRLVAVSFDLAVPENHAKDYDQVIAMLEMSVDEELSIRSDEFACYVMDDWDWKDHFTDVSNIYKTRR
jgi:hypothetical protein